MSPQSPDWVNKLSGNTKSDHNNSALNLDLSNSTDKPRYFSGQYEYEISPTNKTSPTEETSQIVITERMVPITKTVYLIRHAESDENRRLASLTTCLKGLGKLKLPQKDDVMASLELVKVQEQIDSNVSPDGREQIEQLGNVIAQDNFVEKMGIQLVAHSPLKRARQTSLGMLGCVTPQIGVSLDDDPSAEGKQAPSVQRVVELPILKERTPMEWLPINHDAFTKRIAEFEKWIGEQPEDVIAIVGHSQYFKSMLGLPKKFKNCDVWSLQFDYSVKMTHKSVKNDVNTVENKRTQKKLKKKINDALNGAGAPFKDKQKSDADTGDQSDIDTSAIENSKGSSEVYEDSNEIYEIDGIRVDHLELPRGWRDLKRHYTPHDVSVS